MNPSSEEDNSFSAIIAAGVQAALENLYTAMPAIIDKVNSDGTVSALPAISTVLDFEGEEVTKALARVNNVPVFVMSLGSFSIRMEAKAGDEGILLFSQRALDDWKQYGDVRPPTNRRFHELTDAFFLPTKSSNGKRLAALKDGFEISGGDISLTMKDIGSFEVTNKTTSLIKELTTALDLIANTTTSNGGTLVAAPLIAQSSTKLKSFLEATE